MCSRYETILNENEPRLHLHVVCMPRLLNQLLKHVIYDMGFIRSDQLCWVYAVLDDNFDCMSIRYAKYYIFKKKINK